MMFGAGAGADRRLSRRGLLRGAVVGGAGLALSGWTGGTAGAAFEPLALPHRSRRPYGQGKRGGVMKWGYGTPPATLDVHSSAATAVAMIAFHMYEPLFAFDDRWAIQPMLAESAETSSDNRVFTIKLRRGIKFHNGEPLTSADVVASINRWSGLSGHGRPLQTVAESIVAADDHTVVITMKEPYGTTLALLCQNTAGAAIYPKSVLDATGTEKLTQFVGTGPYEFVEWIPDQVIRLKRYEGYQSRSEPPSGYAGAKYAYADEIHFLPVRDSAALVAGLRSEEFHLVDFLPSDQFETVKNDSYLNATLLPPMDHSAVMLNFQSPLTGQLKIRQAIQAAIDCELAMLAGLGQGFFRLDHSIMAPETIWYSDAGKSLFNRKDPAAARRLLDEAKYDGTPLRYATGRENRIGEMIRSQLEDVGFKVDYQIMDAPTYSTTVQNPKNAWDIANSGFGMKPDPTLVTYMQLGRWGGGWSSPETEDLVLKLRQQSDFNTRKGLLDQIQQRFYDEVGLVKLGDVVRPAVTNRKLHVEGYFLTLVGLNGWNFWLD